MIGDAGRSEIALLACNGHLPQAMGLAGGSLHLNAQGPA